MTKTELAKRAVDPVTKKQIVTPQFISMWARGSRRPRWETVKVLAEVLNVQPGSLMDMSPEQVSRTIEDAKP